MVNSNMSENMVFVQGGRFIMGNTYGDGYCDMDLPTHEVEITDFYISKYLVTFDEYDQYCDSDFVIDRFFHHKDEFDKYHDITEKEKPNDEGWGRSKRPVINITWEESLLFCNWLSLKNNLPIAYAITPKQYEFSNNFKEIYNKYFYDKKYNDDDLIHEYDLDYLYQVNDYLGSYLDSEGKITLDTTQVRGYRLPTDAEWEYAAKGGNKSKGYKYSGSNNPDKVAVYYERGSFHDEIKPIATKSPNELGLYDMSGNIGEYVQDWHYSYIERIKNGYPANPVINIQHPDELEFYRVCRAGNTLLELYNSCRSITFQKSRGMAGFRIIKSA